MFDVAWSDIHECVTINYRFTSADSINFSLSTSIAIQYKHIIFTCHKKHDLSLSVFSNLSKQI